jgi:molybdate transport system permease protein
LLLRLFARHGPLGAETLGFDPDVLLTWRGAVIAAATMSLPLVARTARVAFDAVPARLETMGASLGLSRGNVLASITLPLARRGLVAAVLLGFCRALGEFGATIVVAGNIRGRTQTLALAIFDDLQIGHDAHALQLVGLSALLAFVCVFAVERLQRREQSGR